MEKFSKNKTENNESLGKNDFGPRNIVERLNLRTVLLATGVAIVPLTDSEKQEVITEVSISNELQSNSTVSEDAIETVVENETLVDIQPNFEQVIVPLTISYLMDRDEVVFTANGHYIAGPIKLTESVGWTPEEMVWRVNGDEPAVGIPGTWLNEQRARITVQYPELSESDIEVITRYLNIRHDALKDVHSVAEAINLKLQSQIPGDEHGRTYGQLIATEFNPVIRGDVDNILANALREYLPSLIAKESMFNPNAMSSAGAAGEAQILPDTYERYGEPGSDPRLFTNQLPVVEKYFEASSEYLFNNLFNELDTIRVAYFSDDERTFLADFVFPLLITGYNAGDGNVRKLVEWFMNTYPTPESVRDALEWSDVPRGKDVFFAMIQLAQSSGELPNIGDDVSTYFLNIEATYRASLEYSKEQAEQLALIASR